MNFGSPPLPPPRRGRTISRRRFAASGLALALALSSAFGTNRDAKASLVVAMDLPALTNRADRIVVAEVTAVSSAWDQRHERIWTTVELVVAESWKGAMPALRRIRVVQPGGVADNIEMKVHGLPSFEAGERAVLFLRTLEGQDHSLIGLGQGKRPLRFDREKRSWMVASGDRSAAVEIARGKMIPAAPEPPVPLEALRTRIQSLLGAR